jgi:hypothetical protein
MEVPVTDTDIVTRLAMEAGMDFDTAGDDGCGIGGVYVDTLTRFAALVAAECARIIEAQDVDPAFKGRMAWALRDRFKEPTSDD